MPDAESKVQSPKSQSRDAGGCSARRRRIRITFTHHVWQASPSIRGRNAPFQPQPESGDGQSYEPLTPKHFSFNAPAGACPVCHGLGQKLVFDESLVVPDPEKSLEQGAILPWRRGGKRMVVYYKGLLRGVTSHYQQSMETPYKALPADFQRVLLWGSGETEIPFTFWRAGKTSKVSRPFEGVSPTSSGSIRRARASSPATGSKGYEPAILRRLPGAEDSSRRYWR